ncbi:hypothetical protein IWW49_002868 [Coemansia sp. RSA 1797]|nr:hypothetical protein IWW49_002868 [Coemansia sp. RSA 1797]
MPAHEEHPAGPGYNGAPVGNLPEHEEHPAGPGAGYQAHPAPVGNLPAHEEHPAPAYQANAPHY